MYDIAMTVAACLRAGTRADVAWLVGADGLQVTDWNDAVVFTPGGGRIGTLLGGVIDGKLADVVGLLQRGRRVDVEVTDVDAMIAELPAGGAASCLVAPAETLPLQTWEMAIAREPFCLVVDLEDGEVGTTRVYSEETISTAEPWIVDRFWQGAAGSMVESGTVASFFSALPQFVVVGSGPVADAVARLGAFVGWRTQIAGDAATATGLIAPLSGRDMVVIAAHDLELAGAALAAALESKCGYVGSVGSKKMQVARADWLAYRGVTDLSRVRGPAGLEIGADTPTEIAVSIVAEAIASGAGA